MKTTTTTYPKKIEDDKKFIVVDADGEILGRLATRVAMALRGKDQPDYHPAVDMGNYVIVINADKIKLTGNKLEQKYYTRHTLYPGGLKQVQYKQLMASKPEFIIRKAVAGMLPKNSLGRQLIRKLKVYSGTEHPHAAQKPEAVKLTK